MYFPYLRGKQFELLALRELARLPLNRDKISPIIEPLKVDTRGVLTMIRTMPNNLTIQLIVNPEHGEIKNGDRTIAEFIMMVRSAGYENVIPAFLISSNRDFNLLQAFINDYQFGESGYTLLHLNQIANVNELTNLVRTTNCIYNIMQVGHIIALRRNLPRNTLAYLSDPFNRQLKNADYVHIDDENFSSDHLYFLDEGFVGFADYLTIGSTFVDGGRLPWAVVIHFTYKDEETNNIRIKHFVSDSNEDDSDTAGKFAEALDKLIEFIDVKDIQTMGANAFRSLYERGAFPGLGTIKKISIMHHIELVQSLL